MARNKSESNGKKSKTSISREDLEARLKDHLPSWSNQRIATMLSEVSLADSHFNHRTWNFMNIAESKGTTLTHIFDKEYFSIVGYFEGVPKGERPQCEVCFGEKLATGFSAEFGDSPANKTIHAIGSGCLEKGTEVFGVDRSRTKAYVATRKKEILAKRHDGLMTDLSTAFGKDVTIDDLSLGLMQNLVTMRKRHLAKAKLFQQYMDDVLKDQAVLREEFRKEYAAELDESLRHLNSLPIDELVRAMPTELDRSEGKGSLMKRLLGSDSVSKPDKDLIRKMFNSEEEVSPEEHSRIGAVFRMYFPRNLKASIGTIIEDVRRRREGGKIADESYAGIRHIVEDPKKKFVTGEECMMVRWADSEDILAVRKEGNAAFLKELVSKYGIDPVRALKERLLPLYEQDFDKRSRTEGNPASENLALNLNDYRTLKRFIEMSKGVKTADVESNPTNFRRLMVGAFSMDSFARHMTGLSVLARKERYCREREGDLKDVYMPLENFLDSAKLDEEQTNYHAENLGISVENKSREQLSEEIALGIIDRVCNTYHLEQRFCDWQSSNRKELLGASKPKYMLVDRSLVKPLLKQFGKVVDAGTLDDETRRNLGEAMKTKLAGNISGISITAKSYLKDLKYIVE